MGKWGYEQNETFVVASGSLTADFTDNWRIANAPTVIQAFLYVKYTKGNENQMEILIEESAIDDDNPSTEMYFCETISDNDGFVEHFILKLTESGDYRIPLQIGESEDRIKVSVRGDGTPAFTGAATLYFGIR